MTAELQKLIKKLIAFRDARDWRQFHSLKNLTASLNIEAGELLQLTQWENEAEAEAKFEAPAEKEKLADELVTWNEKAIHKFGTRL